MEYIKILLFICIWIIEAMLLGTLVGVRRNCKECFLCGSLVCGVFFGMLSFVCLKKGWYLQQSANVLLGMNVVLLAGCLLLLGIWKKYRAGVKECLFHGLKKPGKTEFCIFFAFLFVAGVYAADRFPLEAGYTTAEQVVTMLDSGRLSGVDIFTGESAVSDTVSIVSTDYLPLFYACLCRWTGFGAAQLLFGIVPYFVLLSAFCMILLWSEGIGGDDEKKKKVAAVLFAFVTICGNGAYMNTSYGLLHVPFEAMTVVSCVLLPLYVWSLLWNKKAFPALLAGANILMLGGIVKGMALLLVATICIVVAKVAASLMERRGKQWT